MNDLGAERKTSRRFRILSLDGGGIKGTYTAAVLACLEAMTGKPVWKYFDLITGTSTGGIIAIALGMGVPAKTILDLYVQNGQRIFPTPSRLVLGRFLPFLRHMFYPKHSQQTLALVVQEVLEGRLFGQSRVRLVIPAFDAACGKIQLFKTAHCVEFKQDYRLPAVDIALATSAAPTYFSAFCPATGGAFLDGGVWANCPAVIGLIEAICTLKVPIDHVDLLSIGTTSAPFDVNSKCRTGGIAVWGYESIELFMQAQVEATLGQARILTDGRLLRIDTQTRPQRFSLDNSAEIGDLQRLGEQAARVHEKEVNARFLQSPADPFEACHKI
jgi:patatin-like phospholipase/acyl hydrolase